MHISLSQTPKERRYYKNCTVFYGFGVVTFSRVSHRMGKQRLWVISDPTSTKSTVRTLWLLKQPKNIHVQSPEFKSAKITSESRNINLVLTTNFCQPSQDTTQLYWPLLNRRCHFWTECKWYRTGFLWIVERLHWREVCSRSLSYALVYSQEINPILLTCP